MEMIRDIAILLALAMIFGLLAAWLKGKKKRILAKTEAFIQWAETQVDGSGMGEKKKELVLKRLRESGIKITKWLDKSIDKTVKYLNATSGWLKDTADIEGTAKEIAEKIKEADSK